MLLFFLMTVVTVTLEVKTFFSLIARRFCNRQLNTAILALWFGALFGLMENPT